MYLSSPLVLGASIPGKPLVLYIAAQGRSFRALCAKVNEEGKDKSQYYLSHALVIAKLNYPPVEKMCFAFMFAIQKLKHHMQAHRV